MKADYSFMTNKNAPGRDNHIKVLTDPSKGISEELGSHLWDSDDRSLLHPGKSYCIRAY